MTPDTFPPLRVSRQTDPAKLAKTLALGLRDGHKIVRVRAMGPESVNQAVKGIILARQFLAAAAQDVLAKPAFHTQLENGDEVTVIVFTCEIIARD